MIFITILLKKKINAELLFTDTDSLIYEIKSKNIYKEFFKWKDLFDFSNYSKDSKFFNETNKKVVGKTKNEKKNIVKKNKKFKTDLITLFILLLIFSKVTQLFDFIKHNIIPKLA